MMLSVLIPNDLHRDLKLLSAANGYSIRRMVEEGLSQYIAEHEPPALQLTTCRKTRRSKP